MKKSLLYIKISALKSSIITTYRLLKPISNATSTSKIKNKRQDIFHYLKRIMQSPLLSMAVVEEACEKQIFNTVTTLLGFSVLIGLAIAYFFILPRAAKVPAFSAYQIAAAGMILHVTLTACCAAVLMIEIPELLSALQESQPTIWQGVLEMDPKQNSLLINDYGLADTQPSGTVPEGCGAPELEKTPHHQEAKSVPRAQTGSLSYINYVIAVGLFGGSIAIGILLVTGSS